MAKCMNWGVKTLTIGNLQLCFLKQKYIQKGYTMNKLTGKVRKPTTYVLPIRKQQVYFCFIASLTEGKIKIKTNLNNKMQRLFSYTSHGNMEHNSSHKVNCAGNSAWNPRSDKTTSQWRKWKEPSGRNQSWRKDVFFFFKRQARGQIT